MTQAPEFSLTRDAFGRLVMTSVIGEVCVGVLPVRSFPITAPNEALALVGPHGEELAWIDQLDTQPESVRTLIAEELAAREFMPEIIRIVSVSGFGTPSTWDIETNRGATRLTLRGEEYIRRLSGGGLLITDRFGIQFLIPDLKALDRQSRQFLDRFL
jgi:hypothetical protein